MPERASTGPLLPITLEQIEFVLFGRVVSDEERCWHGPVQDARIGELQATGCLPLPHRPRKIIREGS